MMLSDILDLNTTLLDPLVSFGDIIPLSAYYSKGSNIELDPLYLNSKRKNGKNLYEEFIEKYYYNPLFKDIFKDEKELENRSTLPMIIFSENEHGRIIKFDLSTLIKAILVSIPLLDFNQDDLDSLDDEEIIKYFYETLRTERKKLSDIKNNGKNSIYYPKIKELITNQLSDKSVLIDDVIKNYIDSEIDRITNIIVGCKYLKKFFDKELDKNELMNCFDFDTFAALCAYTHLMALYAGIKMYDNNKTNPFNIITSPVNYLHNYFKAIETMKLHNPNYNCKLKINFTQDSMYEIINTDNLISAYHELLANHPEFEYKEMGDISKIFKDNSVTDDEIKDMNKRDLSRLIRSLISFEETDSTDIEKELKEITELSNKTLDLSEKNKLQQLKDKIEFLLSNEPVKFLKGKGTFQNYYGYVYNNGYVILDVIDKNYKKSYGNAMYMMPVAKLNEYSESTKKELRNNTNDYVIVIDHRGNWKEKIQTKLLTSNKLDIDIDSIATNIDISNITSIEELEKIKEKLQLLDNHTKENIIEKERKIETLTKIDKEIKSTFVADELYPSEKIELLDAESELLEQAGEKTDFITTHEIAKSKKEKLKRNADVSLQTKLRTKDKNGFMHCDFCGVLDNEETIYGANKSTRMFETHHIIPISEGGIDNLYNTACLCPGCHTRIHNYLKLRKKINQGYEMKGSDFGDYITMSEYGIFLRNVRKRIYSNTPEYLPYFDELFDPNYHSNKDNLSEEEYYKQHKEEEDMKFAINWNNNIIR